MINFILDVKFIFNRKINNSITVKKCRNDKIILECINLFNNEIFWEKMFNISDAKKRISLGETFYVGFYDQKIFGYFWMKTISENNFLIYNLFSKNISIKKDYGATDMVYSILSEFNFGHFYAEVDEWNTKSQRVFEKLGFVKSEEILYIPNRWE